MTMIIQEEFGFAIYSITLVINGTLVHCIGENTNIIVTSITATAKIEVTIHRGTFHRKNRYQNTCRCIERGRGKGSGRGKGGGGGRGTEEKKKKKKNYRSV